MLGAGFVTKPTLDILSESGVHVTVGTQNTSLVFCLMCRQPHLVTWSHPTLPLAAGPLPRASSSAFL